MNYQVVNRKIFPHIVALLIFLGVNALYLKPQLEGKVTQQSDIVSSRAMNGEVQEFQKKTGETYYWNNGMFGGMPWRLLGYSSNLNMTNKLTKVFQLYMKRPIGYFLGAMVCCYLCLALLGVNPWLSAIGSIAFSFNVNFMVLWEAGHTNKLLVISLFPLIFGGLLLTFRKKYLLGGFLFALGISLGIYNNHIQMVYYLALLLGMFYLVYFIVSIQKGETKHWLKTTGVLVLAALLGATANMGQLQSSRSYASETMRGNPILKKEAANSVAKSSSEVRGLEWGYAMSWSNGFADVLTLFVPRLIGGSSAEEVGAKTKAGQLLKSNNAQVGSDGKYKAPMYWGPLPFTSGPYYLGAVVLLLFCQSLFELKPAMRWSIIASFIFCILLSMGKHAEWLNRPLFEYLPLFNKFRAPSSIMNIIPLLVVIPAFLGLQRLIGKPGNQKTIKRLIISVGITGGICALIALLGPELLSFTGDGDTRYAKSVQDVFIDTRKSIMRADALRSLFFVLLGGGLLWAYLKEKIRSPWILCAGLGLLILTDLWVVGKRYLDSDNFISKTNYQANFQLRPVDEQIKKLEPKGRGYYRVHDLSINSFRSSMTSQHHNTIGGYHPAKLQRYQDLIDYYISKGDWRVLNMLNTKYVIGQDGKLQANPNALGNAWFVDSLLFVSSANEEIEKLGNIDTRTQAVILREEFKEGLSGFVGGNGRGAIELVQYEPDHLVYKSNSDQENLAVFSEVWYGPNKGWEVTIDGVPAQMLRANYLLRALKIPAGEHEIVFSFSPVLATLPKVATVASSLIILLGFLGMMGWSGYQWLSSTEPQETKKASSTSEKRKTKSLGNTAKKSKVGVSKKSSALKKKKKKKS